MPNILICSSLLSCCCLHAMLPMVPMGRQSPLLAPFSAMWLVAMPGLQATSSSSTHINADLQQNLSLLHSFEVASFEASQIRAQNEWAVLYPYLSPGAAGAGLGFASQGTGAVPYPEHQAQCWGSHVALPLPGSWLLVSAYSCTFPAGIHCWEGWALDEVEDVGLGLSEAVL